MTAYETDIKLSFQVMLIAIVVLFAIALLILFLYLYLRWRYLRRSHRRRRRHRRLVFAGEMQNGPSPADRGLVPDILKSLPIFVFSNADAGDGEEVVECAVCLNEFEEEEKVRSLPRCGHRFHLECIDMWFYSHANCPLCRAAVDAPPSTRRRRRRSMSPSQSGYRCRILRPHRWRNHHGAEDPDVREPDFIVEKVSG